MTTYFTVADVKMVEASGEEFNTIVKSGTLTITGPPAAISVDGNPVPLVRDTREPFKRVGRDFKVATNDVMSYYYISLPAGLDDSVYDRFDELLGLAVAGQPLTLPKPAQKAKAASAPEGEGAAGAAKPSFFDTLKELGQKAKEDTMAMAAAIKAKGEHDMAAFQESQAAQKAAHEGA